MCPEEDRAGDLLGLIENFDKEKNGSGTIVVGEEEIELKVPLALCVLFEIGVVKSMILNREFVKQMSTGEALADVERFLKQDIFPKVRTKVSMWDLKFFPQTIRNYPNFLPVFYRGQLYKNKIILEAVRKYLKNCQILDVGCGTGSFSKYMADAFPSAQITGVDASPKMIDFAKEHSSAKNISYVVGVFPEAPQQPPFFDIVVNISLATVEAEQLEFLAKRVANNGLYIGFLSSQNSSEFGIVREFHKRYGLEIVELAELPFIYENGTAFVVIAQKK